MLLVPLLLVLVRPITWLAEHHTAATLTEGQGQEGSQERNQPDGG